MSRIRTSTTRDLHQELADAATEWTNHGESSMGRYVFAHGIAHWLQLGESAPAEKLLTDFSYLMARCDALGVDGITPLSRDYRAVAEHDDTQDAEGFTARNVFFQHRVPTLLACAPDWSPDKILLQLALEVADTSPITHDAEAWLSHKGCDWPLLLLANRPSRPTVQKSRRMAPAPQTVREIVSMGQHLVGRADSRSLYRWHVTSGERVDLTGHESKALGMVTLDGDRLLSFSDEEVLLWTVSEATLQGELRELEDVVSVARLSDELLVVHSEQEVICLELAPFHVRWRAPTVDGRVVGVWKHNENEVACVTWEGVLLRFDLNSGEVTFKLETEENFTGMTCIEGVLIGWDCGEVYRLDLGDEIELVDLGSPSYQDPIFVKGIGAGRCLAWMPAADPANHQPLCLSITSDAPTLRLGGAFLGFVSPGEWKDPDFRVTYHVGNILGVLLLGDHKSAVTFSADGTLRCWNIEGVDGDPDDELQAPALSVMRGHTSGVLAAVQWGERIISCSADRTIRIWQQSTGECLGVMADHEGPVLGLQALDDGRFVSWDGAGTLRLWSPEDLVGHVDSPLPRHEDWAERTLLLGNDRALTWCGVNSQDTTPRVWDLDTCACRHELEGHTESIAGATILNDGRIATWCPDRSGHYSTQDHSISIWDPDTGERSLTLPGHPRGVLGMMELSHGGLISWGNDASFRVWDLQTGESMGGFSYIDEEDRGHHRYPTRMKQLSNGRLLCWIQDYAEAFEDGSTVAEFDAHEAPLLGVRELPGSRLATWDRDSVLCMWSLDGKLLWRQEVEQGRLLGIYPCDDQMLAVVDNGEGWVADIDSGRVLRSMDGVVPATTGAHQLPDGALLSWSQALVATEGEYGAGDVHYSPTGPVKGLQLWQPDEATPRHISTRDALSVWPGLFERLRTESNVFRETRIYLEEDHYVRMVDSALAQDGQWYELQRSQVQKACADGKLLMTTADGRIARIALREGDPAPGACNPPD